MASQDDDMMYHMADASSIVPGGIRGVHTLCAYRELLETLATMASRVDLLVSSVMSHRTWSSRLQGVGIIADATQSSPCTGILLRSTGIAWDMRGGAWTQRWYTISGPAQRTTDTLSELSGSLPVS